LHDYRRVASSSDSVLAFVADNWVDVITVFANGKLLPCSFKILLEQVMANERRTGDAGSRTGDAGSRTGDSEALAWYAAQIALARQTIELQVYAICYIWTCLVTGRSELLVPPETVWDLYSSENCVFLA
jgi:hypothetical protein